MKSTTVKENDPMMDPCLECENLDRCSSLLSENCGSTASDNPQFLRQTLEHYQRCCLKYKHLFEIAPDAIFIADTETGIILEANTKAAELIGVPVDQIIGMHQSQLHPPQETQQYKEVFQEHIKKSPCVNDNVYVCNKDGERIPVQINATIAQYGDQKVIYGIFRDRTLKKQYEQQLEESHERLKRLADASLEGVIIHDLQANIDIVSQQFLDMYGYTSDELKQTPLIKLVAPESRDLVTEKIASGFQGTYKAFGLKKDGTAFPVLVNVREAIRNGQTIRIVSTSDLSEKIKLQQQLNDGEEKYRQLYRNAHAALFRTRISDGMLLDYSRATAALFGYENEDEYTNNFSVTDTYLDPQKRDEFIEMLKKDKQVNDFQMQLKRKDGTPIWVEMSAEIFPEQDCIEGVMKDITLSKILSKTEKTTLDLLMKGKSNKEIARALKRSVRTVEDHRSHIMQKLEVDNIVDLTRKALGQ